MRNKKMKKIWGLTTAVILAASSIMAGCGNSQTAKETQPTPVQESSAAAESKVSDAQETEEAQKQAGAKTLVVYSNTDEAGAKAMEGGPLTEFERLCDNALTAYLSQGKRVAFGEHPLIGYLYAREAELTTIRIILTGRLAGLDTDAIRERLRDSYV